MHGFVFVDCSSYVAIIMKFNTERMQFRLQTVFDSLPKIFPLHFLQRLFYRKKAALQAFRRCRQLPSYRFRQKHRVANRQADILKHSAKGYDLNVDAGFFFRFSYRSLTQRLSFFHLPAGHFPASSRPFDQQKFILLVDDNGGCRNDMFGWVHGFAPLLAVGAASSSWFALHPLVQSPPLQRLSIRPFLRRFRVLQSPANRRQHFLPTIPYHHEMAKVDFIDALDSC